jgi:hypothetical protein
MLFLQSTSSYFNPSGQIQIAGDGYYLGPGASYYVRVANIGSAGAAHSALK